MSFAAGMFGAYEALESGPLVLLLINAHAIRAVLDTGFEKETVGIFENTVDQKHVPGTTLFPVSSGIAQNLIPVACLGISRYSRKSIPV